MTAHRPSLRHRSHRPVRDDGQVTLFVVLFGATMVLFAGLVLDAGLALGAKVRSIGQAQEAARAGAQALDLADYRRDGTVRLLPDQARRLAHRHLDQVDAEGTVTVSENEVTVTVTARQNARLLTAAGLDSLTVTGSGHAHPQRGVVTPD